MVNEFEGKHVCRNNATYVTLKHMYGAYVEFCKSNGNIPKSIEQFEEQMKDMGHETIIKNINGKPTNVWVNVIVIS